MGALNAAADIRVIEAVVHGNEADVTILSTYVIVDGREDPAGPIEETLRFVRHGNTWSLQDRRAGRQKQNCGRPQADHQPAHQ